MSLNFLHRGFPYCLFYYDFASIKMFRVEVIEYSDLFLLSPFPFPRHGPRNAFSLTISSEAMMSNNRWVGMLDYSSHWEIQHKLWNKPTTTTTTNKQKQTKNWHGGREVHAGGDPESSNLLSCDLTGFIGDKWGVGHEMRDFLPVKICSLWEGVMKWSLWLWKNICHISLSSAKKYF